MIQRNYRPHAGCTHPVIDHDTVGCLSPGCLCRMTVTVLAGPGLRQAATWAVQAAGVWWLLSHGYDFIRWALGGG